MPPSPTKLSSSENFFVRRERELKDQLARDKLEMSLEFTAEETKRFNDNLDQLKETRECLEEIRASKEPGRPTPACSVQQTSAQSDENGYLRIESPAATTEGPSSQPGPRSAPEPAPQSEIRSSKSTPNGTTASPPPGPKVIELVECAKCGKKTGRMPSAINQLCSKCKPLQGQSPTLHVPSELEDREQSVPNTLQLPTSKEAGSASSDNHRSGTAPSSDADSTHHTSVQRKDFDQLDAENYPFVMWYRGKWREFWCPGPQCGGNVRDFSDGHHNNSHPPGTWFSGMRGLHSHVSNKHHVDPTNYGFNTRFNKMGWHEIARACLKNGLARKLSKEDVKRIEDGDVPVVPIVKRVSSTKTFVRADREQRNKKLKKSLPGRSPTYATAAQARETSVNRSTQSSKLSHSLNERTTPPGSGDDNESAIRKNNGSSNNAFDTGVRHHRPNNPSNGLEHDRRGLKRSKSGGNVGEIYNYESDEDDVLLVPKRRRVVEQVYTSDTE